MLSTELIAKIKEFKEYGAMIDELTHLKDAIADELKALMTATGQNKMTIGQYTLTYTDCERRDLDKKAIAENYADIYNAHLKQSFYKRFTVS